MKETTKRTPPPRFADLDTVFELMNTPIAEPRPSENDAQKTA